MHRDLKTPSKSLQRDLLDTINLRFEYLREDLNHAERFDILAKQASNLLLDIRYIVDCFHLSAEVEEDFNKLAKCIIKNLSNDMGSKVFINGLH